MMKSQYHFKQPDVSYLKNLKLQFNILPNSCRKFLIKNYFLSTVTIILILPSASQKKKINKQTNINNSVFK